MNTMTFSPLQNDYVTKTEFNEFRGDVDDNFRELRVDMERNNEQLRSSLNKDAERHMGMLLEIFQHNLKASSEQLEAKLDKKLDRAEFYEYMELHFPSRRKGLIK